MSHDDNIGPPKDWLASREWAKDEFALQEEKEWVNYDDLEAQKLKNRIMVHKCIGYVLPITLIFIFLLFLLAVGIYAFHLLSPENWHFLSTAQVSELHNIIFSSVVGAGVAHLARQYTQ